MPTLITFSRTLRAAVLASLLVMMLASAVACSNNDSENGTKTSCSLDGCTITFDRGVDDAKASILGIEAELVKVDDDQVTLEVAGQRVTVPQGEQVQSGDYAVTVDKVTDDEVVVKISRASG